MDVSHKTKFRLTLELYGCGLVALVGLCLLPWGVLLLTPAVIYLRPIARELKTRREPLARKQKHMLFGLQASFCAIVVIGLLVIALLRQTPAAWIFFGLSSVIMLCALYSGYDQIYKDEPVA